MFQSDHLVSKEQLLEWGQEIGIEFSTQKVKKGDVFLEGNQRCQYFYYIERGFIRIFYFDLEGRELTHWFSSENMMITSPFSFLKDEHNILNFEALEDSELILITKKQWGLLRDTNPKANRAILGLSAEFAMRLSRRVMSIHTESAEHRYVKLLEDHPLIFQKAKLVHIASYLGVTQQSLSRIRKRLAR